MTVCLWLPPNIIVRLMEGLREAVDHHNSHRTKVVWGTKVSPWKQHAIKNSHLFRRWDDLKNFPNGAEMRSLHDLERRLGVRFLFPDETKRPAWDKEMMARGPSDATAKDSVLKVRGPPAQLKIAIDDIEDRLRRLTQVAVRISDSFYEGINTAQCLNHLGAMQVDAYIKEPANGTFECTLTGTRKQDLDIAHQEFAQMVHRLAKGLP
ncbi:hypothetical protein DL93DRAFT_2118865, partial [Clavulina sp. PMI_390]